MATATLFHLLPNVPVVTAPDAGTQFSAGATAHIGERTTQLLDPAWPVSGATQQTNASPNVNVLPFPPGTLYVALGRWLTRGLPAQTINAGNWTFYGVQRASQTGTGNVQWSQSFGFTLVQWRPSTASIVARLCDTQSTGVLAASGSVSWDAPSYTTLAGSSATLSAGDCLGLEVWGTGNVPSGAASSGTLALCYNGFLQHTLRTLNPYQSWAQGSLTNTDAYLLAPQGITYS